MAKKKKIKVLFMYKDFPQHMQRDLAALKTKFKVEVLERNFNLKNPLKLFEVTKKIRRNDVVFLRFANEQNLRLIKMARKFGKKTVLLSGGYDAVVMPDIDYGLALTEKGKKTVVNTFNITDTIVAFSDSSRDSILELAPRANVITSYVGSIDTDYWRPKGKKDDIVITVGHVKWNNLKRKGLETFVRAAKYVPDNKFILIGGHADDSIDHLKKIATKNVEFTGFLDDGEMLKYLQRARVYVQASGHEGFGISLANAMACECVPVGTKRGSLPEVIADTGFFATFDKPKELGKAIKKALATEKGFEKKARKHIVKNFYLDRREKELIDIVESLFQGKN